MTDLRVAAQAMLDAWTKGTGEQVALDNLETALSTQPTDAPQPAQEQLPDYKLIAHLVGVIFFAGDFKAETENERQLENLLAKVGRRYSSWDEVDAGNASLAAPPAQPAHPIAEPTKSPLLDDFLNAGARENITHLNFSQNTDTLHRQLADMTADRDKWQTAYNDALAEVRKLGEELGALKYEHNELLAAAPTPEEP